MTADRGARGGLARRLAWVVVAVVASACGRSVVGAYPARDLAAFRPEAGLEVLADLARNPPSDGLAWEAT